MSIIPVIDGRMQPPEYKSTHTNTATAIKSFRNGIGEALKMGKIAREHVILSDLRELKPPRQVVTFPPVTTPRTGPVTLINANAVKTTVSSWPRTVII